MRSLFIILALILNTSLLKAQSDSFTSLDIGFDYLSNTATFGQFNQFSTQPTIAPSLFFVHKSGFTIAAIANYIGNSDTTLSKTTSEYDLSLGYFWQINPSFALYPTYTRYFFPKESLSLMSGYTDNWSLDANYTWKITMLGINSNYLIGDQNQWFLTGYLAFDITKEEFISDNGMLFFQPEISFNFGEQTYFTNVAIDQFINDTDYRRSLLEDRQFRNKFNHLQNNTDLSNTEIIRLLLAEENEIRNNFNLNSIGFTLPVNMMFGNFSFTAGFSYYQLFNQPDYIEEKFQTYINAGMSYSFFWEGN